METNERKLDNVTVPSPRDGDQPHSGYHPRFSPVTYALARIAASDLLLPCEAAIVAYLDAVQHALHFTAAHPELAMAVYAALVREQAARLGPAQSSEPLVHDAAVTQAMADLFGPLVSGVRS